MAAPRTNAGLQSSLSASAEEFKVPIRRRTPPVTLIDNRVFDAGLSWPALGFLAYVLSQPNGWRLEKVDSEIEKIADELVSAGFMVRNGEDFHTVEGF